MRTSLLALLFAAQAAACGAAPAAPADAAVSPVGEVPEEPQRAGDPQAGYLALVNNPYVSCGIPYSVYSRFVDPAPEELRLPGREGHNAEMPYDETDFVTPSGVEVVTANCLSCHAGFLNNQLVIGLGAADADFTSDPSSLAVLAGNLIDDPVEHAEWQRWADRVVAVGPYTAASTVGVNPADNLAAVLFAHHDRDTLAWSADPLLELPPNIVVPVDVPPWWRMKKKHALFYTGAGRGDQARLMMAASVLCTDTTEEADAIDSYFPDIRAYLLSLEPPAYPYPVDAALAAAGKPTYDAACAGCHGTPDDYPNLIVPLDDVDTDSTLALGASQFAGRFVDWFNNSWFSARSRLAPAPGYYAPPLDGVWATAPFLHNGSVPTIAALLDSTTRPTWWTRTFDSTDYDPDALGWHFTALDHGQDDEPDSTTRKRIYDTTQLGYGNGGHTYGDDLTPDERRAVIEYLKTL